MRIQNPLVATLALIAAVSTASWGAEKEEHEQKITADQVPAAAKATLDQQTAGATKVKYEKEQRDGKTVYTAEVKKDGKETEYVVSEDGKLLATEDEDEDKDKDKGEKKEHHDK